MSEEKDSLRSKVYARLLHAVCEGPIEGLVDGARSIFIDDTALQNSDGSNNFDGVTYATRDGLVDQDYIEGFGAAETTTSVNTQVFEATPVVRTITNPDVDAVRVTIAVPILQRTDKDDGDIEGTTVSLRVEVQPNGGGWTSASGGVTTYPMAAAGTLKLQTDAGIPPKAASVTVEFVPYSDDEIYQNVQVDYRPVGSSTWTKWGTYNLRIDAATLANGAGQGATSTARQTISKALPTTSQYEFRAVYASPVAGLVSISGTYDTTSQSVRISGKTSSRYQRSVYVRLPAGGAPWTLRVTRMTDDSDSAYLSNDTWWDSYTEITEQKLRYPHTALVAMTLDSESFSSVPTCGFDMRLLKVQVPSNYDPIARTYTGSWDGTFVESWTDNPAWCLYDLLTHPRYGLGQFVGSGVDKWSLYAIAQYCDELVPNGFGGVEPRFCCNLWLASRDEAYTVVQDLASVLRGMVYWAGGSIVTTQDAPADPVHMFTRANVIGGRFEYSGSSAKARHTVALVTWNDPSDMCRQKVEYVEDRAGIARFGVVETSVAAIGCTSRGQAHRVGRWLLYSEQAEAETVTFRTGLEAAPRRPGEIIAVADPARAGVRLGGRLRAATTTTATLDAAVSLQAGQTYTFACHTAQLTMQSATVTTPAGSTDAITFAPALAEAPAVGTIWTLSSAAVQTQLFRVIGISEAGPNEFEVTALAHDPSKFAAIESGLDLTPRSTSLLTARPSAPTNLAVTEALYRRGSQIVTRLDVSWTPAPGSSGAVVVWRRNGASSAEQTTREAAFDIDGAVDGQTYIIDVYAVNALGLRSASPATATHTVVGKQAPPADVSGFVVARSGEALNFTWWPVGDVDCDRYEIRRGESWQTGAVVSSIAHPTNTVTLQAPRGGTYMVKAVDTSGNYSAGAIAVVAPDIAGINVVLSHDESAAGWGGSLDGTVLMMSDTGSWDALTTWSGLGSWDSTAVPVGVTLAGGVSSGSYTTTVVDIGYTATALVSLDPDIRVQGPLSKPWAAYNNPWTHYNGQTWVWQASSNLVGATYEVQTSEDGSTWSDWAAFSPGAYRFRYIRVRVTLYTDDEALLFTPALRGLVVLVDVPDRVLHFADHAVPTSGATLAFSPAFVGIDTVQVTLQSAAVGDTYTVAGKSVTGVTVRVFGADGTPKSGLVDVDVFGYGER